MSQYFYLFNIIIFNYCKGPSLIYTVQITKHFSSPNNHIKNTQVNQKTNIINIGTSSTSKMSN